MTLDHIGAYQVISYNSGINDCLRIIGRIAAPLFLFIVVEGLRHTHSMQKYILRLYVAGIIIEIFNQLIARATGVFDFGNTLPTFFYVAYFVFCLEKIKDNRSNIKEIIMAFCGIAVPFLLVPLYVKLSENGLSAIKTILSIFVPSPFTVEYSIIFVLLGMLWYFIDNKYINCAVFAVISLICLVIPASSFFTIPLPRFLSPAYCNVFGMFVSSQWLMCLSIPFMLLYNGERGRDMRWFFYIYYPVHAYLLFAISQIEDIFL